MSEYGAPDNSGVNSSHATEEPENNSGGILIKDSDMSTFMADVIEKSTAVPVLVSFWADWSENCKKLNPILEKVIRQAQGAVQMVRINFAENQQLAAQMKIQSVPTVVVFAGQRPVDAFAGLKSEEEVKKFISNYAPEMQPSPAEEMIEQAKSYFEAGDYQSAGGLYSQVMQAEPDNVYAIAGLVQSLVKLGDLENARTILDTIPKQHANHAATMAARAALDIAHQLAGLGDADELVQAIEMDEDNHQARFELALILWAQGRQEDAGDQLLEIIRRDRSWHEDGARKQLLKFFEIIGPMEPYTVMMRKKLSSILFS